MRPPLIHLKEWNYSPSSDGLEVVSEVLGMYSEELNVVFCCSFFVSLVYFYVREKVYLLFFGFLCLM
ncbi:MAG: hypothetical protein LBC74_04305 [Planctomycetaceae bacterium]|nr:hypothetical protein [Planctomycetaceae bacterium]